MASFVQPEKSHIKAYLDRLTPELEPRWGQLRPSHLVEHLIRSVEISRGAVAQEVQVPEKKLEEMRSFLYSDEPFPQGVKSVNMPEGLPELQYENIEDAKEALMEEWDRFVAHYREHPDDTAIHPVFGELGKEGWEQVHRKHFTHHFQQFGLLEE